MSDADFGGTMRLWETFDLASLLVGLLIGAVLAFLLRLHALKRLSLDVRKIGFSLGVEGFQEPVPETGGVRFGNVAGSMLGDIAGRDIKKSHHGADQSRRLYNILQNISQLVERDGVARVTVQESFRASSDHETLRQNLNQVSRDYFATDRFRKWVATCLRHPDIREQIDRKVTELEEDGWNVRWLEFDNIENGIYIRFGLEKSYQEFTCGYGG
jgi:hypothetical protein